MRSFSSPPYYPDYLKQIKPILRERCFACHGALKQEGGLRLDTAALASQGGDSGAVIQPGDAAASLLLKRVTATDDAERMPPQQEGEQLTATQVAALGRWIAAGAKGPDGAPGGGGAEVPLAWITYT